jgi:5-hydroxyisourate hydrolase-like protein (transthyretin family)
VHRLLIAFLATPLSAAFLQCVVLDHDSGRPLARSLVTVEGVQGGQSLSRSTLRTDRAGSAYIGPLADGAYIITVARAGFATQQYGQSGWNHPGLPLMVQGDRPVGIQIRLRRLPSISGTVWDENQIGIPNAPIVIYTGTRPAKVVAKTTTDDRGIYRAGELVPGTYIVRNAAKQFEDGLSIVPTFYPDGNSLQQARTVEIDLERSAQFIDFAPTAGRLFRVTGRVISPEVGSATVELISDTGRVTSTVHTSAAFSFDGVAPGTYEMTAQIDRYFGYIRLLVDRDQENVRIELGIPRPIQFLITQKEGNRLDQTAANLFARRKDLDADGPVIPVVSNRTILTPGNWEIAVSTSPTYFPMAVLPLYGPSTVTAASRADGWNPFVSAANAGIRVVLSNHPASLHGRVVFSLNNPAPEVPVFLETLDLDPNEQPQVRQTRTDQNGNYQFTGLPPGSYRVVSSYDADPTNRASIEAAHPRAITLSENGNESQDLEIVLR